MPTYPSSFVGDYIPLKTLGSGSTGKVKLARHIHTGKYVALKIIKKDLLDRKRILDQKVHREIAVMKLITGNCRYLDTLVPPTNCIQSVSVNAKLGVLGLLDIYDTDNSFVLVLDYCEGGELFDSLIEIGHFPQHQVLDYFQQLVYALEFCHNRGICHRDLKPENVLLTADGRLKLADFGMASLVTPGCFLETSCGSPQYCAPEILLGGPYEGTASDIWSLGVVLFAMTTGGLPFNDENLQRLTRKIQSGAFYMPPEVPDHVADLIRSMLVVDPAKRATIKDIKHSKWFNSQLSRDDIYKDEDFRWKEQLSSTAERPVIEPNCEILRYLADLGLGDFPTIRRRLAAKDKNVEKEFYSQLANFCRGDLSFREIQDIPTSPIPPNTTASPNSVNSTVSPFMDVPQNADAMKFLDGTGKVTTLPQSAHNAGIEAEMQAGASVSQQAAEKATVEPSWFPDWTFALARGRGKTAEAASKLQMEARPSRPHGMQSR